MQTDSNGYFTIKNVIPGVYGLHGWVPGFIGDYLDDALVTISAGWFISFTIELGAQRKSCEETFSHTEHWNDSGSEIQLGNLTYVPRRDGLTAWEIGFPDRTALGYYVPDVNPALSTNCLSIVQRSKQLNSLIIIKLPEKIKQVCGLWLVQLISMSATKVLTSCNDVELTFNLKLVWFIYSIKQVQAIWLVGQIPGYASSIRSNVHNRNQQSKKGMVLCSRRHRFDQCPTSWDFFSVL